MNFTSTNIQKQMIPWSVCTKIFTCMKFYKVFVHNLTTKNFVFLRPKSRASKESPVYEFKLEEIEDLVAMLGYNQLLCGTE